MRKTLAVIAILAVLLVFPSAYNAEDVSAKVNSFAPGFTLANGDSELKLSDMRGKFVLLNFWSSDDAVSRIRNIMYSNTVNKLNSSELHYAAVNYDRTEALYKEIILVDGVDGKSQFFDKDGSNSEVYRQFRLQKGFNSYLISREGKVLAVNPSTQQLADLLCQ